MDSGQKSEIRNPQSEISPHRSPLTGHRSLSYSLAFALLLAAATSPAAVLVTQTETFESGANGWGDRDAGEMAVTHQSNVGNPASGAMRGVFAAQDFFPLPETDAFQISSGTNFIGSYENLTGFRFDFFADNVLPSDLALRIWSGSSVFFYAVTLGSLALDTWTTFTVPLTYSSGWQDGGESAFNSALLAVDRVEVQVTRSGMAEQYYYLDNFRTTDDDLGGGGEGGAVPEPSTGMLVIYLGAVLYGMRKHLYASREWDRDWYSDWEDE